MYTARAQMDFGSATTTFVNGTMPAGNYAFSMSIQAGSKSIDNFQSYVICRVSGGNFGEYIQESVVGLGNSYGLASASINGTMTSDNTIRVEITCSNYVSGGMTGLVYFTAVPVTSVEPLAAWSP